MLKLLRSLKVPTGNGVNNRLQAAVNASEKLGTLTTELLTGLELSLGIVRARVIGNSIIIKESMAKGVDGEKVAAAFDEDNKEATRFSALGVLGNSQLAGVEKAEIVAAPITVADAVVNDIFINGMNLHYELLTSIQNRQWASAQEDRVEMERQVAKAQEKKTLQRYYKKRKSWVDQCKRVARVKADEARITNEVAQTILDENLNNQLGLLNASHSKQALAITLNQFIKAQVDVATINKVPLAQFKKNIQQAKFALLQAEYEQASTQFSSLVEEFALKSELV